jgi:glycosyltransferase involved in cell wall biosynthesis
VSPFDSFRHLGILSHDPFIIMSCVDSYVPFERSVADLIAERVATPFALVLQVWQSWEYVIDHEKPLLVGLAASIQRHLRDHPENEIWIACNTEKEVEIADGIGLSGAFLNHNAYVSDHIFHIQPDHKRIYDAVYSAQMWTRKRHELAAQIESICLIFAMHLGAEALRRFKEVHSFMPHAVLCNGDPTLPNQYCYLSPAEVNKYYNMSKVGLCLSAHEGASLASLEYLLAGCAVVSTPSLGGRDVLFQEPWCSICEPTPESVKDAVQDMIDRSIDPEKIRNGTLTRVESLRAQWISFVDDLKRRRAASTVGSFADVFPSIREHWCGLPYKSVNILLSHLQ